MEDSQRSPTIVPAVEPLAPPISIAREPQTAGEGLPVPTPQPPRTFLQKCDALLQIVGPLLYLGLITSTEVAFIQLYCWWHGAKFISLQLYSPENVRILSTIDFVNGPKPLSIIAEVLMWSSLGVWAWRSYTMTERYKERRIDPARDIAEYMGTLIRNTSIASIIITLLAISEFQLFGKSVKDFAATAGLSFLLGFFGDDSYNVLKTLKQKAFGKFMDPPKPGEQA